MLVLISSSVCFAQETKQIDPSIQNLAELNRHQLVRVVSADHGLIGGIMISNSGHSLTLGFDKRSITRTNLNRRLNYKPRAPKHVWKPIDSALTLPYSSIMEIRIRKGNAKTGAIVGGSIVGTGGLLLAIMAAAMDDSASNKDSEHHAKYTAIGALIGGAIGALIGSLFKSWKLHYRQIGYRGDLLENDLDGFSRATFSLSLTL